MRARFKMHKLERLADTRKHKTRFQDKDNHYLRAPALAGSSSGLAHSHQNPCVLKRPCSFISLLSFCDIRTAYNLTVHMTYDSVENTNQPLLSWLYSCSCWCGSCCMNPMVKNSAHEPCGIFSCMGQIPQKQLK